MIDRSRDLMEELADRYSYMLEEGPGMVEERAMLTAELDLEEEDEDEDEEEVE